MQRPGIDKEIDGLSVVEGVRWPPAQLQYLSAEAPTRKHLLASKAGEASIDCFGHHLHQYLFKLYPRHWYEQEGGATKASV